ncbi:MAG: RNA degradosome polyphosphate kinase, partial [Anaerolineales bacterium]
MPDLDLNSPAYYINRELSLLEFQRRVLEEAHDESNPLLERIKFLSIFGSNMDEFFMVRVSGIRKQVEANIMEVSADGMTPRDEL